MNTIASKNGRAQLKAIKTQNIDGQNASTQTERLSDSPRAFGSQKAKRKLVAKTTEHSDRLSSKSTSASIRNTLRAQIRAGKNDSAEMYQGIFKSPAATPKAQAATPRKLSDYSVKDLAGMSDEDFENLSIGGDEDEASLNTGWNEWGIDSDSDSDETPKANTAAAKAASPKHAAGNAAEENPYEVTFNLNNEWALSDDEE